MSASYRGSVKGRNGQAAQENRPRSQAQAATQLGIQKNEMLPWTFDIYALNFFSLVLCFCFVAPESRNENRKERRKFLMGFLMFCESD